jgi:hypothetical protein
MDGAMTDPNAPDHGIGMMFEEPIGCGHGVFSDLKGSAFDVYGNDFAVVVGFDLRSDLGVVEGVSALGGFFFGVGGIENCHGFDLTWFALF